MHSFPAHDVKGGDVVVLHGRRFEVFDTAVLGSTVTIRLDSGRWGDGVRSIIVDADHRLTVAN